MARGLSGAALRMVGALFRGGTPAGLTDGELLDRFALGSGREAEAAFAGLVERHGPMVLRVCRGELGDDHDAEDAFQATFLVLARRARTIRRRDSVASWLHGVARRVSARSRAKLARRRRLERRGAEMTSPTACDRPEADLAPAVREEVGRLPEKFREPVVLCYLEGLSHDAAAERLGWPVGTVRSRLAGARDRLRSRLARRGLAPSAALLASSLAAESASAAVRPALAEATARAAVGLASGATSATSADVLHLVIETSREMTMSKLKILVPALLAAGLATSGAVLAFAARTAAPPPPRAESPEEDPILLALRRALPEAEAIAGPDAKAAALLDIGKAQASAGDRDAARATLRKAERAAADIKEIAWRLNILTTIGEALTTAGDRDAARALLARIGVEAGEIKDLRGQVGRVGEIAVAQARMGDHAAAREAIRLAHKKIEAADDENQAFNALSDLIESQTKAGDYDGALGVIAAIPAARSNLKDPLLRDVAKAAESATGPEVLKAMRRAAEIAATISYEVPRGLAEMGVSTAMAKAGDVPGAIRLALSIAKGNTQFPERDTIPLALASIAEVQVEAGDRAGAKATLDAALEVAKELRDDGVIKPERLRRVAEAQAKAGDADGADRTAELIGNNDYEKAFALAAIGEARARLGQLEKSREAFRRAVAAAEGFGRRETLIGDDPDRNRANVLREIAEAEARSGDVAGAIAIIEGHGDDSWRAGVLTEVASIQARAGDLAGALKTAEAVKGGFYKPYVCEAIAHAQAKAGDVDRALAWAAGITSPEAKARALAGLARGVEERRGRPKGSGASPKP